MLIQKALITILCALTALTTPTALRAQADAPWPSNIPGFQQPEPGEHPRLLFRKADLPEIRRRATETEEGKAIVARLRQLLGNDGEKLPDAYNTHYPVNIKAQGPDELPLGAFTIAHAAGYGMLYQLAGDEKYADMARASLEMMFDEDRYSVTADKIKEGRGKLFDPKSPDFDGRELSEVTIRYGQPDRDERYTWTRPGAKLRLGAMMLNVALAYDLCYDAWPEDFRKRVVDEIQNYNYLPVGWDKFAEGHKGMATMDVLVNSPMPPRSNHFGAYIGGAGIALLAIRNDPGTDMERIDPWLERIEEQMIRQMTAGFGDGGFFAEGHGPSHLSANQAFVPLLQVARVAWGKDFITPRPNGQWITLRWAMEIVPGAEGKAYYPNYKDNAYGNTEKWRGTMSEAGEWSQGFGALANADQQAAMLWTYKNAIERTDPLEEFDSWVYPHRAVFALVNWPIGLESKNPGDVIGHANADRALGHFRFRAEWQGPDDRYVTFFLNPPDRRGYVRSSSGGNFTLWGHGLRDGIRFNFKPKSKVESYDPQPDGSGTLSFLSQGKHHAVAVDFPKADPDTLVIVGNPWFSKGDKAFEHYQRDVGREKEPPSPENPRMRIAYAEGAGYRYAVMWIDRGQAPEMKAVQNGIEIDGRLYAFDGQQITLP